MRPRAHSHNRHPRRPLPGISDLSAESASNTTAQAARARGPASRSHLDRPDSRRCDAAVSSAPPPTDPHCDQPAPRRGEANTTMNAVAPPTTRVRRSGGRARTPGVQGSMRWVRDRPVRSTRCRLLADKESAIHCCLTPGRDKPPQETPLTLTRSILRGVFGAKHGQCPDLYFRLDGDVFSAGPHTPARDDRQACLLAERGPPLDVGGVDHVPVALDVAVLGADHEQDQVVRIARIGHLAWRRRFDV
jgi:hypothetical protein